MTAVDRLKSAKVSVPLDHLEDQVDAALTAFDRALFERAQHEFQDAFALAESLEDLRASTKVRQIGWCGSEECGHQIEAAIEGSLLGVPEGAPPIAAAPPAQCIACRTGRSVQWALAGRPI